MHKRTGILMVWKELEGNVNTRVNTNDYMKKYFGDK